MSIPMRRAVVHRSHRAMRWNGFVTAHCPWIANADTGSGQAEIAQKPLDNSHCEPSDFRRVVGCENADRAKG